MIPVSPFIASLIHSQLVLGAPPGYIGHDKGGPFTDAVQRKPYSVMLFCLKKWKKSHPEVFRIMLHMIDGGRHESRSGLQGQCGGELPKDALSLYIFRSNIYWKSGRTFTFTFSMYARQTKTMPKGDNVP